MANRNFKQKWLDALAQQGQTPGERALEVKAKAGFVSTTNTDAALALRKISSSLAEVSLAATSLVAEMDSHMVVAGLEFGEIQSEIDAKLTKLPADIAMRRIRDLIKVVEARLGVLHAHAHDLHISNEILTEGIEKAHGSRKNVTRALYDVAWVGDSATQEEIEDFNDAHAGEYHRDGLVYEDMDEEYIMTKLFAKTSLRTVRTQLDNSDDEGDDEDNYSAESDPEDVTEKQLMQLASRNRRAQIVPASPKTTGKVDL